MNLKFPEAATKIVFVIIMVPVRRRRGYRAAATSKMEHFVIIVNG